VIDLSEETVICLSEAPRHLPRRDGRAFSLATVYRWSLKGCRGVRLETLQIGGRRHTSMEALQRFAEQLTSGQKTPEPVIIPIRREREIEAAERELIAHGA